MIVIWDLLDDSVEVSTSVHTVDDCSMMPTRWKCRSVHFCTYRFMIVLWDLLDDSVEVSTSVHTVDDCSMRPTWWQCRSVHFCTYSRWLFYDTYTVRKEFATSEYYLYWNWNSWLLMTKNICPPILFWREDENRHPWQISSLYYSYPHCYL
jgi:predicted RNA-binding protein